jgi:hypothetical protein
MSKSLPDRFASVQDAATSLLGDLSLLRMVCESDTRADDLSTRTAGFVGRQFVHHATERAIAALRAQRQNTLVPFIDVGDCERFVAHCASTAAKLGVDATRVEDALLSEAELAVFHARDALKRAHDAYRLEGLDLATKCGVNPPTLTRAEADAGFLDRIEQEFPEFADRTGREAFKAAICRLLEAQRAKLC